MLMKEANFFLLTKCFHSSRTFLSLAVGGAVCCFLSISHCCLFHTWCHPLLQLSCENACEITFNEGNISSSKGTSYHHFCHLDYTSKIGTSQDLLHLPLTAGALAFSTCRPENNWGRQPLREPFPSIVQGPPFTLWVVILSSMESPYSKVCHIWHHLDR